MNRGTTFGFQHHLAAVELQRNWRGYYCRFKLWSFGGVLLHSWTIKIQKLWRGWRGRAHAAYLYHRKLYEAATRIKIRYLISKARRLLRKLKAEKLLHPILRLQGLWRCRVTRRWYLEWKRELYKSMATRIQSIGRSYLGRRRGKAIRKRVDNMIATITDTIGSECAVTSSHMYRKLRPLDVLVLSSMDEWTLLDVALKYLLVADRPTPTISVCTYLATRYPKFLPGLVVLQCCLLYIWPKYGIARLSREDLLDEVLEATTSLKFLSASYACAECFPVQLFPSMKHIQTIMTQYTMGASALPLSLQATDPVSLVPSILDEIQITYFGAALRKFRRSSRILTVLACWIDARNSIHLGLAPNVSASNLLHIWPHGVPGAERSYPLLTEAKLCSSESERAAAIARLDTSSSLFGRGHELLLRQRVLYKLSPWRESRRPALPDVGPQEALSPRLYMFPTDRWGSPAMDEDSTSLHLQIKIPDLTSSVSERGGETLDCCLMAKPETSRSSAYNSTTAKQRIVSAETELYRAGEMIIVRAYVVQSDEKSGASMRSSSTGKGSNARKVATASNQKQSLVGLPVRPLVLFPAELESLMECCVSELARRDGVAEADVRKRGRWRNISELLLQEVRLVSCYGSRTPDSYVSGDVWRVYFHSNFRLTLPVAEYSRRERNNMQEEAFAVSCLQRAYRGFRARAMFRRMLLRIGERRRQKSVTAEVRGQEAQLRSLRHACLARIQSAFRGWRWRRLLAAYHRAAIRIQTRCRILSAKLWVAAELRRRLLGPEVFEVYRRSVRVGGKGGPAVTLVVNRCGNNYRVFGWDRLRDEMRYECLVLEEEARSLVERFNTSERLPTTKRSDSSVSSNGSALSKSTGVMRLSHHSRVAELIVQTLAVTASISAATTELGAGKRDSQMCLVTLATATGVGIEHINSLHRVLADQHHVADRYKKIKNRQETGEKHVSAVSRLHAR